MPSRKNKNYKRLPLLVLPLFSLLFFFAGSSESAETSTLQLSAQTRLVPSEIPVLSESEAIRSALKEESHSERAKKLKDLKSPAAALLRARILISEKKNEEALIELKVASEDPFVARLALLEEARIRLELKTYEEASLLFEKIFKEEKRFEIEAAVGLSQALSYFAPEKLVLRADEFLKITEGIPNARSAVLIALERAYYVQKDWRKGHDARKRAYVEEPLGKYSPRRLSKKIILSREDILTRAERLLKAHKNDQVLSELEVFSEESLSPEELCRYSFLKGTARRKLRHYAQAELALEIAANQCKDKDLARRAHFLWAKVISIRAGLRAIKPIETFAKRYPEHTMVDDTLFWAGDLYQRRSINDKAAKYYQRILSLPVLGDHCSDAAWRLSWMAYKSGETAKAKESLLKIASGEVCEGDSFEKARALYWLGRVAQNDKDYAGAEKAWAEVWAVDPFGYYAQIALARAEATEKVNAAVLVPNLKIPVKTMPPLCVGELAEDSDFHFGLELLRRGLIDDASAVFLKIAPPEKEVVATAHAAASGKEAQSVTRLDGKAATMKTDGQCTPQESELLLTLLLDASGAHRDAHWRLRTSFREAFAKLPDAETGPLWYAAYPLAFRDIIGAAEKESGLPTYFIQALAREESALDPSAVSWAGAYGLTQLLLSSAQAAGKLLKPKVTVKNYTELFDARKSARLGAALMADEVKRFKGNLGLALAAYNAGAGVARTWSKRHSEHDFDVFGEEMTIRETRGYVKRVLRTYGIYRWLYGEKSPALPVDMKLPKMK